MQFLLLSVGHVGSFEMESSGGCLGASGKEQDTCYGTRSRENRGGKKKK